MVIWWKNYCGIAYYILKTNIFMLKIQYRCIAPFIAIISGSQIYENNSFKETNVIISLLI